MAEVIVRKRDGLTARVDEQDARRLSAEGFCYSLVPKHGRQIVEVAKFKNGIRLSRTQLHRYILGVEDRSKIVKAHNDNYLDCRRDNLYVVSRSEISANMTREKQSDLPQGVKFESRSTSLPYTATIRIKGMAYYLGGFATAEEAGDAYQTALYETYYGEVALIPTPTQAMRLVNEKQVFVDFCVRLFL